jgi:2-polyprenyl-3-methyl-5-hydroxy-6-metoxy-1,4-benzoquinol methylase
MNNQYIDLFKKILFEHAGIFEKNFERVVAEFGDDLVKEFDIHLEKLFGTDEARYLDAVNGYRNFAIDAMRLQNKFNKKLRYEDVSYEDACEKVYLNEDYMMKMYLPGIFVSHFLWRHHYKQFLYYKEKFLPLFDNADDKRFYDVGTGTGFYSVQIFRHIKNAAGYGIDISPHSRRFTRNNVAAWGFDGSFTSMNVNIIGAELEPLNFVQSVEVLEHLSDPQTYLNNLRKLLAEGGYGFVTAALTAPNADHIYLYWNSEEVIEQLNSAGFKVIDYIEEYAYEAKDGEHVPKLAAFIIT